MNAQKRIYLDHAATTPVRREVKEAMLPFLEDGFGNPSSVYKEGNDARAALDAARRNIAVLAGGSPENIIFTSGGTESDNWALRGIAVPALLRGEKPHIITDRIEHHAILRTAEYLEKCGVSVTYLEPDSEGMIDPDDVRRALRPETVLISIMTANNEIGTVEPVEEIAEIAREAEIPFHTDAVQAFGHISIPQPAGEFLFSVSAHKFGGPKGTGFLFQRMGKEMENLIFGGSQERGRRAGTENTPGIAGLSAAASLSFSEMEAEAQREEKLSRYLLSEVREIPGVHLNGPAVFSRNGRRVRLPGNVNLRIDGVLNDTLLMMMDMQGISISAGSACSAGAPEPSHVLTATGKSSLEAGESIRVTLGPENTREDIDAFVQILAESVIRLRKK